MTIFKRQKNWYSTLFLIAFGYYLKEQNDINEFIFYILPLIPMILFWFYSAHLGFFAHRYYKFEHFKALHDTSTDLHAYSKKELTEKIKMVQNLDFRWDKKGEQSLSRFFSEKIPGIFKESLHMEYSFFMGQ